MIDSTELHLDLPTGWGREPPADANEIARAHRTYDDGLDVVVTLRRTDRGFEVRSCAEMSTSGPSEAVFGRSDNMSDALQLFVANLREWDDAK